MRWGNRGARFFVAWIVAILGIGYQAASAEDPRAEGSKVELPEGVPLLPESSKGSPIVVSATNLNAWKALVVPELLSAVKNGDLSISARRELGYFWRIDDEWEGASYRNAAANKLALVSGSTTLRADIGVNGGYPFGAEPEMLKESDPSLLGARIVWNAQSVWWGQGSVESDFDLTWIKEGRPTRILRGQIVRAYPATLGIEGGSQLFRELLTLTTPEPLKRLAWLTFRFRGGDEDVVWFYSPALQKARQLTGSNRSDVLARGATAVDDLLVWSGKAELIEAVADRSAVGFAPFADTELGQLAPHGEGCFGVTQRELGEEGSPSKVSPALAGGPEVLGDAVFVPRRLWRVELTSSDPYSHYGRQVLYVDKVSMLPVYKFVYDRSGHLWKTVIGVFGLGVTADRKVKRPYASAQVVIDHLRNEINTIDYNRFVMCRTPHEGLLPANFDPRKLWPQPTPAPEKPKSKKKG
ncbi:MAG: hypothetical protein RL417_855 [Pseudomonadota bacterium]|jgi:hypothetical protein